jgi:hypothetical protein
VVLVTYRRLIFLLLEVFIHRPAARPRQKVESFVGGIGICTHWNWKISLRKPGTERSSLYHDSNAICLRSVAGRSPTGPIAVCRGVGWLALGSCWSLSCQIHWLGVAVMVSAARGGRIFVPVREILRNEFDSIESRFLSMHTGSLFPLLSRVIPRADAALPCRYLVCKCTGQRRCKIANGRRSPR